jgi:hypothetical protein
MSRRSGTGPGGDDLLIGQKRIYADAMDGDSIDSIVNAAARMALEGIVSMSYTPAERERLEHAAQTGEWRPLPPAGA